MTADLIDQVANEGWYYSVELKPGLVTRGICPPRLPMLPRMLTRNVAVEGMDCLDVGTMEGLIPALLRRRGAGKVLAVDAVPHCQNKLQALALAYGVTFEFRTVGLMYDMHRKLADRGGFDFINFSGVNYHVFSPMHCIAGLRPLLRRNGLMIIGTNVVNRGGHSMEFNDRGRLQAEANTFWYLSVPMMDYMARYFRLVPIDCLYYPHSEVNPPTHVPGMDLGYLVMVCRAVDEAQIEDGDEWARRSRQHSWEYLGLANPGMTDAQPISTIGYNSPRAAPLGLDLFEAIQRPEHIVPAVDDPRDSHFLMLDHQS